MLLELMYAVVVAAVAVVILPALNLAANSETPVFFLSSGCDGVLFMPLLLLPGRSLSSDLFPPLDSVGEMMVGESGLEGVDVCARLRNGTGDETCE